MTWNFRVPVLLTVWLGGMALVWASEQPAATESTAAQSSEAPSEQTASSQAAADAAVGPTPDRFVPSEQVRADFDVAFPIDM